MSLPSPVPSRAVALLAAALLPLSVVGCHRSARVAPAVSPASAAADGACAAPAAATAAATATSLAGTPIANPLVTFDSAWSIIARTHWDTTYNGVNWTALRDTLRPRAAAATTTGELRGVLSEMVGRLKQSHFSIIPREISDGDGGGASGSKASVGESGTIGAEFRLVDGATTVSAVMPNGAAARAGVRTGWILESVHGCALAPRIARGARDMEPRRAALVAYTVASQLLAGEVGQPVVATFRDESGRARAVTMVRQAETGTMAKFGNLPPLLSTLTHERVTQGGKTIGIIRFNIWMPVLSPQFDAAMDSLRDTDAIILDVRGNFGGVGGMSMGIAGHFLDSALTIGTMQQRGASLKFVANPRRVDTRSRAVTPFAGPLALLVDELSISTTEIFAGGLQALGRARVFGAQTSGQALPSVPERLPNGDILYHAIADFLSPTGKPLEGDGVRPDALTPLTRQALLAGKDPAREAALAWAVQAAKLPAKRTTP